MTVKQVANLTGVSVRTLQFYDEIGLLKPAGLTEAGYRLYDENTLETVPASVVISKANKIINSY